MAEVAVRSSRHTAEKGITYQAFREGNKIEIRLYIAGKRMNNTWVLLAEQWPKHSYNQYRLIDALLDDTWIGIGRHSDAALAAVNEVISACGLPT